MVTERWKLITKLTEFGEVKKCGGTKFTFLGFCMNTDKIIIKLRVVFHVPEIRL